MNIKRTIALLGVIGLCLVGTSSPVQAAPKKIPLLVVGFANEASLSGTTVEIIDLATAKNFLNQICSKKLPVEIVVKSDGKTLAAKNTQSFGLAKDPTFRLYKSGMEGYGSWVGICIHPIAVKKMPKTKFYEFYGNGILLGTVSYVALKKDKFQKLFGSAEISCFLSQFMVGNCPN